MRRIKLQTRLDRNFGAQRTRTLGRGALTLTSPKGTLRPSICGSASVRPNDAPRIGHNGADEFHDATSRCRAIPRPTAATLNGLTLAAQSPGDFRAHASTPIGVNTPMPFRFAAGLLAAAAGSTQTIELVIIVPGEFEALIKVALPARLPGLVEGLLVDRSSIVRIGDLLLEPSAPETDSRIFEAERVQAEAQRTLIQFGLGERRVILETPTSGEPTL